MILLPRGQGQKNQVALDNMHKQLLQTELRSLNQQFVSGLQNTLLGLHPQARKFTDWLQLIYPFLYGVEIGALLQDD